MSQPSKYTLWNALAFVAITGKEKGLHINTRIYLTRELVEFQCKDLSKPCYLVTDAGMELARKSRLYKAHEHMLSMGFVVRTSQRRQRPGMISYVHQDDVKRSGFITHRGDVYVEPVRGEDGKWQPCENVATYRNG